MLILLFLESNTRTSILLQRDRERLCSHVSITRDMSVMITSIQDHLVTTTGVNSRCVACEASSWCLLENWPKYTRGEDLHPVCQSAKSIRSNNTCYFTLNVEVKKELALALIPVLLRSNKCTTQSSSKDRHPMAHSHGNLVPATDSRTLTLL